MRSTLPLLLLGVLGCEPTFETTGPIGMVGRVLGPDGAPVAGLTVESVETPRKTDAEGRFQVGYQRPNQHVHFRIGQVWFQRGYLPEDEGSVVEIALPAARNVDLICGEYQGDLTLRWTLGPGYLAEVHPRCEPGETPRLEHVPRGEPEVRVRQGEPPVLTDRGERLIIEPPLRPLRVELRAEGARPERCEVWIGERQAEEVEEGVFSGQIGAPTTVAATCDGKPAQPIRARAAEETVSVEWSGEGPVLDLVEHAPWAKEVLFRRLDAPEWTIRLGADAEGRYALPVLAPGSYAIYLGGADAPEPVWAAPPPEVEAGVLLLSTLIEPEARTGTLKLAEEQVDGQVRVRQVPGEAAGE